MISLQELQKMMEVPKEASEKFKELISVFKRAEFHEAISKNLETLDYLSGFFEMCESSVVLAAVKRHSEATVHLEEHLVQKIQDDLSKSVFNFLKSQVKTEIACSDGFVRINDFSILVLDVFDIPKKALYFRDVLTDGFIKERIADILRKFGYSVLADKDFIISGWKF